MLNNTRSCIRRGYLSTAPELAFIASGLTSPTTSTSYWAMVDKDTSTISFGLGTVAGQNVLMKATDPFFLANVQYVSFAAWDKPVSYSNIKFDSPPVIPTSFSFTGPANTFKFNSGWVLPSADGGLITFNVGAVQWDIMSPARRLPESSRRWTCGGPRPCGHPPRTRRR